jgi:hypothetical protein
MRNALVGGLIVSLVFFAACGGGSGGGTTSPTFTNMSELPKATSPMASSASAQAIKDGAKAATTGMNLQTTTEAFFNTTSSRGGCEMFNLVREGVSSAAQADMILCYVDYMNNMDSFSNLVDQSGNPIDVYDGQWHIFNLDIVGDEYAPDRVKMRIVKNAAGSITSFEMFMCANTPGGIVQNEYTRQSIDGTSFEMRAIGQQADAEGSGWHSVDVTGTLNSSGAYTQKAITVRNKGSWGGAGNLSWEEGTVTQTPGNFTFSGYQAGNWQEGTANGTYGNSCYGLGEMLGDTSTELNQLAMGDGAAKYDISGTWSDPNGQGTYEEVGTDAWLGDDASPVVPPSDSGFYNAANAGDLPTIQTQEITIGFGTGESWDCTDDVGVGIVDLPQAQQSAMNAACSEYVFDYGWINCYYIIEGNP